MDLRLEIALLKSLKVIAVSKRTWILNCNHKSFLLTYSVAQTIRSAPEHLKVLWSVLQEERVEEHFACALLEAAGRKRDPEFEKIMTILLRLGEMELKLPEFKLINLRSGFELHFHGYIINSSTLKEKRVLMDYLMLNIFAPYSLMLPERFKEAIFRYAPSMVMRRWI